MCVNVRSENVSRITFYSTLASDSALKTIAACVDIINTYTVLILMTLRFSSIVIVVLVII